jgi:hypothetical protein
MREDVLPGLRSDQCFVRLENARSRASIVRVVARGGNAQQITLRQCALGFAGQSSSTPTSHRINGETARTTWRWHEPCRTQQFALRFADRMLRNLGAPIHCFEQLMRAIFLRSSLITTTASTQSSAPASSSCVVFARTKSPGPLHEHASRPRARRCTELRRGPATFNP